MMGEAEFKVTGNDVVVNGMKKQMGEIFFATKDDNIEQLLRDGKILEIL